MSKEYNEMFTPDYAAQAQADVQDDIVSGARMKDGTPKWVFDNAKRVVESLGFLVVKKDRLQTIGAQEIIPLWTAIRMHGDEVQSFERHVKDSLARRLGVELAASPAARWETSKTGEDLGTVIQVRATVLMPDV